MRRFLPIVLFSVAALALFSAFPHFAKGGFSKEVAECNAAASEVRFSCYRSVIEKYYRDDPQAFIARLESDNDLSFEASFEGENDLYAIFGTNCHTFYHAAGDFLATHMRDDGVGALLAYGPAYCTNGYIMGAYKRFALDHRFATEALKELYGACKKGAENQCAHEIGHILHDKYSYSILKVLDALSRDRYGLTYPVEYSYATLPKGNLDAPFEECEELVPADKLAQCFTGIGHNLFLFSEFSPRGYAEVFDECSGTDVAHRDDCYAFLIYRIGINEAAPRFLRGKFAEGNEICARAVTLAGREDLKYHCYLGIGGGIGLFVDSEYAAAEINEQNIALVKQQLSDYLTLCEKSEEQFVDECFAGVFGTRFAKLYGLLKLYHERVEILRPHWDTDFEVVG